MIEADVAAHLRNTQQKLNQMLREKIGEYNLSFRLLHIIMLIEKNPKANQKEIANQLKLTEGAISGYIKRLIDLKILAQKPSEDDQRCNQLTITEHGQDIIRDYEKQVKLRYKDIFVGFTEYELQAFRDALIKINANLDRINPGLP
ncbi:MAG: MarR family transcriptional regulator [Firmicutes bacterium]|jgi:DNA-binding MarR family transcriptional regulator|nr:MarR family transcriptional regulator [Bacillota bacterium]